MIFRAIIMPVIAVGGLCFAGWTVSTHAKPIPIAAKVAEPAQTTLPASVAGSGIIESASENLAIGSPLGGIVVEVPAKVGATVKAGEVLFRLDDRTLKAQLAVQEGQLAVAQAQLDRLGKMPRAEDLPPAETRVATAATALADAEAAFKLYDGIAAGAASVDERDRKRFAVEKARAQLAEANAALTQLKAGAWQADLAVQQAQVAVLQAQIAATRIELKRLEICAPIAGTVLQVRIRPGEFAPANTGASLVMLGDTTVLHVRVDFDENDAWRVKPEAKAEAFVRGNRTFSTTLRFVRIEPYVIPKKNLTNDATERVDTRVLQVLYAVESRELPLYVGQLMDVFVAAESREVKP
jgi:multidrug efflux pump subunit AcrA (membrane-fusion protein)